MSKPLVLSATQVETFDPRTTWGCNRKWYFERVRGLRGGPDKSLMLGDAVHQTIERFLRGEPQGVLHDVAMPGVQTLLSYRPRVKLVEHKIELGQYEVAGVPFVGKIDAVIPDLNFELIDWKTTSSIGKYAKTKGQLRKSVQMTLYADYLMGHFSEMRLEGMRWTLGYFGTKKREHDLVSVDIVKREIADNILTIEDTVSKMVAVAAETDLEKVAPNEAVCNIGFGCPHRAYCPRSGVVNMASLLDAFSPPAAAAQPERVDPKPDPAVLTTGDWVRGPATGVLPPDGAPRTTPIKVVDVIPPSVDPVVDAVQAAPPEDPEPKGRGRPKGSKNKPKEFSPPGASPVNPGPPTDVAAPTEHVRGTVVETPSAVSAAPTAPALVEQQPRSATPMTVERITLRHGSKVGMPNFSSITVEAEYTAIVTGNAEAAREALSMLVRAAMHKELEVYVKAQEAKAAAVNK